MNFHIPDDDYVRAISDARFRDLLAQCYPDGRSADKSNPAPDRRVSAPSNFGNKNEWHEKPLGKVLIAVVGGVVLAVVLSIFKIYFGLPL